MLHIDNLIARAVRKSLLGIRILIVIVTCCLGISNACARTLDEITKSNSFSICASPDDLPYSAKNSATPGFYIEIAQKISDALGVELNVEWIPSREQIRNTKCDAVMGTAAPDEVDKLTGIEKTTIKARILTVPYMTAAVLLVMPAGHQEVRTIGDLKNLHVAVPSGSVIHKLLNDNGVPVWVRFRNDTEIIDAVLSGSADAGVVSQAGFGWYLKNNPKTTLIAIDKAFDDPALQYKVAIGLRRTNIEAVTRINEILKTLTMEGVISEILGKYGIKFGVVQMRVTLS
jgi:polar amino acid transport system substrate-binding protein